MPTPTLGRVVIYHVGSGDTDEIKNNGAIDLPAIIVKVWSDTCVNLKVLTDGPRNAWKTSVVEGVGPYLWSWPTIVK